MPGNVSVAAAMIGSSASTALGLARLDPTYISVARVLELGCAAGGNIIPLAARNPNASFIGIDLSSAQVESGRARIAQLGLSNIELRCESFSDAAAPDAAFDYIVCHGVYSWVPA